jgi:LysR family glycine cleavage system transcriptional activator
VYAWQEAHPGVSVYLDGSHSEPSPDAYEIDFRISYGDRIEDVATAVELFRDSVVPVCSPRLLQRDGAPPLHTPADILAFPLISIDWLPKFASPPSWREWFATNDVDTTGMNDTRRVFSLSSLAIQAAIDGQGFVLAQCSMVVDDLAAGRLTMPFASGVPLPWPYFLTWTDSTFDKPHCRGFHRWLVTRGKEQQEVNDRMLGGITA